MCWSYTLVQVSHQSPISSILHHTLPLSGFVVWGSEANQAGQAVAATRKSEGHIFPDTSIPSATTQELTPVRYRYVRACVCVILILCVIDFKEKRWGLVIYCDSWVILTLSLLALPKISCYSSHFSGLRMIILDSRKFACCSKGSMSVWKHWQIIFFSKRSINIIRWPVLITLPQQWIPWDIFFPDCSHL